MRELASPARPVRRLPAAALDVAAGGAWACGALVVSAGAPLGWRGVVVIAAASVSVALARRRPLEAFGVALAGAWLGASDGTLAFVVLPALALCVGRVSCTRAPLVSVPALLLALTGPLMTAVPSFVHRGAVLPFASLVVIAWVTGMAVRQRQHALAERHRRLVQEERASIARDLHDVLAHTLSLMTVQAAYGRVVVATDPARAAAALAEVETHGRQALGELRELVGALRDPAAADSAPRTPAPSLAQVPTLVQQARGTGLVVSFEVDGQPRPLPDGLELSAYRIVQEALTNVIRHADAQRASVRLAYRAHQVEIEVVDDGTAATIDENQPGHGLLGIEERVSLHGGTLACGPLQRGGFGVLARLPVAAAS